MTVRLVLPGADLAGLSEIHAASFSDAWSAQALGDLLAMPGTFALAAQDGFVMVRIAAGEAEILTLAVSPRARRHGTGTALIVEAADHAARHGAQTLFLEVAADNLAARTLYRKLGLTQAGLRKAYYTQGREIPQDALILSSTLPLSPLGKSRSTG